MLVVVNWQQMMMLKSIFCTYVSTAGIWMCSQNTCHCLWSFDNKHTLPLQPSRFMTDGLFHLIPIIIKVIFYSFQRMVLKRWKSQKKEKIALMCKQSQWIRSSSWFISKNSSKHSIWCINIWWFLPHMHFAHNYDLMSQQRSK